MKLHLYLFLLLADLSVGLATSADADEAIDSDVERMMKRRKKKRNKMLLDPAEDVILFTRSYLTIAGSQVTDVDNGSAGDPTSGSVTEENPLGSLSFALGRAPDTAFSSNEERFFSVRGSSFLQSGPIYNPDDVQFIDCVKQPRKDSCENFLSNSPANDSDNGVLRYGGGKQPNVVKLRPPKDNFFFNGECTTVAGFNPSQILAHSCFYNLCLGGLGEDCVNIFAGGGFIFDPFAPVQKNEEPLLPPSFPGAIIGGTGKYQGIKGSAQIVTITSRTSRNLPVNFNGFSSNLSPQTGYITQLVQLETTQQLPPSKTQESSESD
jgi:hypothetical protein